MMDIGHEPRTTPQDEPYQYIADCSHEIQIDKFFTEFDRETFCDECLRDAVVKWLNIAEPEEIARIMKLQRKRLQYGD